MGSRKPLDPGAGVRSVRATLPSSNSDHGCRGGDKPLLLWFGCASSTDKAQLRSHAARHFEVAECPPCLDLAPSQIERVKPRLLCFDFDFPDRKQLRVMQNLKRRFMRLPVLMLTLAHSEALAVWAFRTRVWNYLVKPVPLDEFDLNLRALVRISAASRAHGSSVLPPEQDVPEQIPARVPQSAEQALLPAVYFVERRYHTRFGVSDVAALCGMNHHAFSRAFQTAFGMPFKQYVTRHRIREACRMLRQPHASVTDVAHAVGFTDHSYFDRVFKAQLGTTPGSYKRGAIPADSGMRIA